MKKFTWIFVIMISFVFFAGCKKDDNKSTPKEGIHKVVSDSIVNIIKDLGMPINEGTAPPNIEKSYYVHPFALKASNIPGDGGAGTIFADYTVHFYEQNNTALSIKMDYLNGPESGTGLGSFISGSGNKFTVAAKLTGFHNSTDTVSLVQVISGTVVSGAINAIHVALFMIDNYGNASHYWIENGQGRVFQDSDGVSEEVNWKKSSVATVGRSEWPSISARKTE